MVDIDEEFESCLALQHAAEEALNRFNMALRNEYLNGFLKHVRDTDWHPEVVVHRLSTMAKTPIALRKLAYDVLNDCRHALDQTVVASSRALGVPRNRGRIYFPFATDEADFATLYDPRRGRCRDTAPVLIPELKKERPWWGGDDELRTLGKLSGPNKHQVIIEFASEVTVYENREIYFPTGAHAWLPPVRLDKLPVKPFGIELSPVKGRTDFIIAVVKRGDPHVVELDGAMAILAAKEATRFPYRPINVLLQSFVTRTSAIIERIKAFTIEQLLA